MSSEMWAAYFWHSFTLPDLNISYVSSKGLYRIEGRIDLCTTVASIPCYLLKLFLCKTPHLFYIKLNHRLYNFDIHCTTELCNHPVNIETLHSPTANCWTVRIPQARPGIKHLVVSIQTVRVCNHAPENSEKMEDRVISPSSSAILSALHS